MNKLSGTLATALLALVVYTPAQANKGEHDDVVQKMDVDKNGMITRQEYMNFYQQKWQKLDTNNTGSVSVTQLRNMQKDETQDKEMRESKRDNSRY